MIILSLGSNLQNTEENLAQARKLLAKYLSIEEISQLYESEPIGVENHPWYLNQVVLGNTNLTAQQLLKVAKEIEQKMGRDIHAPDSSTQMRPLDIDILFYNDECIEVTGLMVPHPRLHLRRFVLEPLAEIAPNFVHPKLQKTVRELLKDCPDRSIVRLHGNSRTA
ncbi:2-amino-4-hydroxy-6-hydroxymethyldihydropteridine diphosphokinase [Candidatus Peregrinibacteria bacterium CG11_big_fil_rev_8_21_14_0_20_46_8]|nr:MAG: 2-amino-4-hydroxy-6-hydroxymethyldihydropteridine diphosphokinase [Candidatus Peregrinibacteria bacterium CG11_big_fil_rev_8_21_14_0_20_46_8]